MKIELLTAGTLAVLGPFLINQKHGRDIITRSMLMVPQDNQLWLYTTDGIAHLRARIPAVIEGDPIPLVLHLDSLHSLLKSGRERTTLTLEGEDLWGEFYGGRLHIQTFHFDPKLFQGKQGRGEELEGSRDLFLRALTSLHRITETTDIPDLRYIFMTSHGAFASNGSLVAKVEGEFPEVTLRHRDSKLLEVILDTHQKPSFQIRVMKDRVMFKTDYLDYVFPIVSQRLPNHHKSLPGRSEDFFSLPVAFLKKSLHLLQDLPSSSGVLSLDFGETLRAGIRSKKGQVSDFQMAYERTGAASSAKVQTLVKTLLLAASVFHQDERIQMGVRTDGSLLMWTDNKALNFTTKPSMG